MQTSGKEGDAEAKACLGWTFSGGMGGWPVLKIDPGHTAQGKEKVRVKEKASKFMS